MVTPVSGLPLSQVGWQQPQAPGKGSAPLPPGHIPIDAPFAKGYGKGVQEGSVKGFADGYAKGYKEGVQRRTTSAGKWASNEGRQDDEWEEKGSSCGSASARSQKKRNKEAWKDFHAKYTPANEDTKEAIYSVKLGKNNVGVYPEEIQVKLRAMTAEIEQDEIEQDELALQHQALRCTRER